MAGLALRDHTDVLPLRNGVALTLRDAEPQDAELLQGYFRALSPASRYSRLMGAAPELPPSELLKFVDGGEGGRFTVIASLQTDAGETVVAESRYALDGNDDLEFGLSVADSWQRQGVGAALLSNLSCRAAALGAVRLFGDTLRSNAAMIALARKSGFGMARTPNDWKQVRFAKPVSTPWQGIPCLSWRLVAKQRAESQAAAG